MQQEQEKETGRCPVCGAASHGGLCDCCREIFALCDMENLIFRRERGENVSVRGANAFK